MDNRRQQIRALSAPSGVRRRRGCACKCNQNWFPPNPNDQDCSAAVFTCVEDEVSIDYLGCLLQPSVYAFEISGTAGATINTLGTTDGYKRFYMPKTVQSCNYWTACPSETCADIAENFPGDPTSTPDCRLAAQVSNIATAGPWANYSCVMEPQCKDSYVGYTGYSYTFTESVMCLKFQGDDTINGIAVYTKPLATWNCNADNTLDLQVQAGSFFDCGLPASITVKPSGVPYCLSGLGFI